MLASVPCGFLALTIDGIIRLANNEAGKILSVEPSALRERNIRDLRTRGGAIFYETQFSPSLLLRRSLEEISFDFLRPDGRPEPVLVNAVIQAGPSASGEEEVSIAIFRARQRRLYESELLRARRESEQVSQIVRRSSDAIIRFTADATIGSWKRQAGPEWHRGRPAVC